MRMWPRSLFGRLLGIATLTTLAALVFAAFSIGHVLERFVIQGLDQQLDAEIGMLARAVRADGTLDQTRVVNLPAFEVQGSGWGWRVQGGRGQWTGGDAVDAPAGGAPALVIFAPDHHRGDRHEPRPGDGMTPSGRSSHYRQTSIMTNAGAVILTASGPRRMALAPLREAMVPLLGSLAVLGAALALATALQLRFGLRPLRSLQSALADVRAGRLDRVPAEQPQELAPLADELNALIDQNEAQLEHARRHVANLAHGLKTPLAALGIRLAETGGDPDGSLGAMVAKIDGHVRHHLARARATAPGGARRARTLVAPAVADLAAVMERIHVARHIRAVVAIAPELAVAIDPQDLDEMVGNLLDNAWRHARFEVTIRARIVNATVELAVEDDGPGLSATAMGEALLRGRRLDEQGDGFGFGLSIVEELAELNGGRLTLDRSAAGGLSATLILPAAALDAPPMR